MPVETPRDLPTPSAGSLEATSMNPSTRADYIFRAHLTPFGKYREERRRQAETAQIAQFQIAGMQVRTRLPGFASVWPLSCVAQSRCPAVLQAQAAQAQAAAVTEAQQQQANAMAEQTAQTVAAMAAMYGINAATPAGLPQIGEAHAVATAELDANDYDASDGEADEAT